MHVLCYVIPPPSLSSPQTHLSLSPPPNSSPAPPPKLIPPPHSYLKWLYSIECYALEVTVMEYKLWSYQYYRDCSD